MARILVVDDRPGMRVTLTTMLSDLAHQVVGEATTASDTRAQYMLAASGFYRRGLH